MLRLIIALIYTVLSVIVCMPRHFYLKHQIKKDHMTGRRKSQKLVRGFFRGLLKICGTEIEVRGEEKLLEDKAALYVGNHRSYFDIIIPQTIVKTPLGFIAKKEFHKVPLFHCYMDDIGCLYLDRKSPREGLKTINQGIEYMKDGLALGLFPEGTRNHGDKLMNFKPGGYRMAEKSGCPIVLMALTNFDDIYENNKHGFIKKTKVIIEFSDPVYVSEMSNAERKQFYADIPNRIQAMLDTHK